MITTDTRLIILPKAELDKANKDTKHYPPNFQVCASDLPESDLPSQVAIILCRIKSTRPIPSLELNKKNTLGEVRGSQGNKGSVHNKAEIIINFVIITPRNAS